MRIWGKPLKSPKIGLGDFACKVVRKKTPNNSASQGPTSWPFLRRSTRAPTIKTSRAAKRGCFKRGGGSQSGLVLPFFVPFFFFSFWDFLDFFRDFPDLFGDSPGIFPICPLPLCRPINSTNEEQSRKGPRHNPDLSRKKWETARFGNPPGLASLKNRKRTRCN